MGHCTGAAAEQLGCRQACGEVHIVFTVSRRVAESISLLLICLSLLQYVFFFFSWVCGFSILVVRMVLPCGIWERDFCGFQEKRP